MVIIIKIQILIVTDEGLEDQIYHYLEDNTQRGALEELNELKNFNENIPREEENNELIELENEELRLKKGKEKKKRNVIKHSHGRKVNSHQRDTYDTNGNTDEFSGEAARADTDTCDTSASDGEFSFNGGNGHFVCENVCAEYIN